jgi:hypothetical protein
MVNNHHIVKEVAEQHAAEVLRHVAATSARVVGEPSSAWRRRLRRPAHTGLIVVKETIR